MNYKIDYNYFEITNSPSIEYYLEKRAREGWMIEYIYLRSIFIFKRIEPVELDFSIHPYKLESDSWNYVDKSFDLYIYYKEYKAEADSFKVEADEEYKILEAIGKKRIQGNLAQLFIFFLLGLIKIRGVYTSPDFLKNGGTQLAIPFIVIGLTIAGWRIIHVQRFLKMNREKIEAGKDIEYSDSMFLVPTTTFFLGTVILVLFTLYFFYIGIVSRSFIPFIYILTILNLFLLQKVYLLWMKPDKVASDQKKMIWAGFLFVVLLVGIGTGVCKERGIAKDLDVEEYKVLTIDTFSEGELDKERALLHNMSLLIPKSYEYYYISDEGEYVETEYARAVAKDFATDLTKRYIDEKKKEYRNFYHEDIKLYFDEGIFNERLLTGGISEGALIRLKSLKQEDAEETAHQLIEGRSISEANDNLWNADEAYFLSYAKDELLIRSGKEVFYLYGKDFMDPFVIKKTKERLGLD